MANTFAIQYTCLFSQRIATATSVVPSQKHACAACTAVAAALGSTVQVTGRPGRDGQHNGAAAVLHCTGRTGKLVRLAELGQTTEARLGRLRVPAARLAMVVRDIRHQAVQHLPPLCVSCNEERERTKFASRTSRTVTSRSSLEST
jgi:hypothetical protein